ncbi:MAG TPA: hypothetical protein V6C72_13160, partial [Chroococcales cyanobacterium]
MDSTIGLYCVVGVVAIGIAVGLRFVVYMMLVKNARWLPEKATKVANITSAVAAGVSLLLIVGNAVINKH